MTKNGLFYIFSSQRKLKNKRPSKTSYKTQTKLQNNKKNIAVTKVITKLLAIFRVDIDRIKNLLLQKRSTN